MGKRKILIVEAGKKYNRLMVVSREPNTKHGHASWKCLCECGNVTVVTGSRLRDGHTKSCGCYRRDLFVKRSQKYASRDEALFMRMLNVYKRSAKKRNVRWKLTDTKFRELVHGNCHYCGLPPSHYYYKDHDKTGSGYLAIGIDRVNNDIGYTKENSVSCCKDCNISKGQRSYSEFMAWINKIYKYNLIKLNQK